MKDEQLYKNIKVDIQYLHPNATTPVQGTPGSTGYDCTCTEIGCDTKHGRFVYHLGIAVTPEKGYVVDLRPRSNFTKTNCYCANTPGTIDNDYPGELRMVYNLRDVPSYEGLTKEQYIEKYAPYKIGDRVCQMIIRPDYRIRFNKVNEIKETTRTKDGFGSTGIK